jgi:hypothetical protein
MRKRSNFMEKLKDELSEKQFEKLLKVIAINCEKYYRRGAQQALVIGGNNSNKVNAILPKYLKDDLYSWRFRIPLSKSPGLDGLNTTSLERLQIEGLTDK